MKAQISLFDAFVQPGDYVETHGPELTFDAIAQFTGKLIVMDKSTESRAWFQVARVEEVIHTKEGRRLIYYAGKKQRGLVNERYFVSSGYTGNYPVRGYEMTEKGAEK